MRPPSGETHLILQFFDSSHLPRDLQGIAQPIEKLAHEFARNLSGAELEAGLRLLLMAKDSFVRAAIAQDRSTLTRADVPAP